MGWFDDLIKNESISKFGNKSILNDFVVSSHIYSKYFKVGALKTHWGGYLLYLFYDHNGIIFVQEIYGEEEQNRYFFSKYNTSKVTFKTLWHRENKDYF